MEEVPMGLIVVAGVTFPCAVLYYAAGISDFLPQSSRNSPTLLKNAFSSQAPRTDDSPNSGSDKIKLKTVLKEAATVDNTVILTTLNEAWAAPGSVLDLFLESFKTGESTNRLLKHLVIVALDEKAYERCKSTHPHCYALKTQGVDFSQEKLFLTEDYLKMIWRRIYFLRVVLEMGYHFIFTDADIMWFRDPMPFFYKDCDFQIACDRFNGNPDDRTNSINGGFKYIRSNERTIKFYKYWYDKREEHPGSHDQDVLNHIKGDQFLRDIGLCMKFLPTVHFGGICEPSSDFNNVSTMHANCCIGLKDKLNDLRIILEDWRLYNALWPGVKRPQEHKWRVPQVCR
ncbi:unnamed protein product [Spirodela intermedia]|uniref:Glycosyltransferase n=1 Tax=Spirodela intermedia TaxID=51605 RepID=A0A7I8JUZ4_SPIIN|nr:unnamed protein product [Spirodela intermedia]CAA6673433.1 unnamed protein product [Spirodela intermedia]